MNSLADYKFPSSHSPIDAIETSTKLVKQIQSLITKVQSCLAVMQTPPGTPPAKTQKPNNRKLVANDLVGIELNPGPPSTPPVKITIESKKATQPKKKDKKKKSKRKTKPQGLTPVGRAYYESLMNPFSGPARIPDPTSIPTSVISMTADLYVEVDSFGYSGIQVYVTAGAASVQYRELNGITSGTMNFGTAFNFPAWGQANTSFSSSRIISAGLSLESTASSNNDQGLISAASTSGTQNFTETIPLTRTDILSCRENYRVKLRDGISVRFKPIDNSCDEFSSITELSKRGTFTVLVEGAAPASKIMIRMVVNYECINKLDTASFVEQKISPVEAASYSYVRSLFASVPSFDTLAGVGMGTQALYSAYRNNYRGQGRRLD